LWVTVVSVNSTKYGKNKDTSQEVVLTSVENIRAMEKKEREKKEKARLKEERKRDMEKKRKERAKLAAEKKQRIEAKKIERARIQKERSQLQNRKKTAKRLTHEKEHHYSFTEEEIKLYERRFENGYDLKTDERYNAWLKGRDPSGIGELSTGVSSGKKSEIDDPPYNFVFDDSIFDLSLGDLSVSDYTG
jgi:hypothetical protein